MVPTLTLCTPSDSKLNGPCLKTVPTDYTRYNLQTTIGMFDMPSNAFSESAPPHFRLDSLPGEVLSRIMTYMMVSGTPVYFWLYLQFSRNGKFQEAEKERLAHSKVPRPRRTLWIQNLPENQREHYLDWRAATSTSRRLRECGTPAFFRQKEFIVPTTMLQALQEDEVRSSTFDMAVNSIEDIVVPIDNFVSSTSFIALPKYHHFKRLKTLTIDAGSSVKRIMDGTVYRPSPKLEGSRYIAPRPLAPPKELLDLLARLGLRHDQIELRLIATVREDSEVDSIVNCIVRKIYPDLRLLIRRRAKPGDPPL